MATRTTRPRRGISTARNGKRFFNTRDLLGHWNARPAKPDQMCPHACCQGRRVHPANFPVILPQKLLREATDAELADHYRKYGGTNENARRQIEAEFTRRERKATNAQRAKERRRDRAAEHYAERERIMTQAEAATNGYMVNEKGRARGIQPFELFTRGEDFARRYATGDLLRYWENHPRTVRSTRYSRSASRLTNYGSSRLYDHTPY